MMKKLIMMLLCGVLSVSFVACSSSPSEEVREEQNSKEFELGKIDGFVYENNFIGIGCALDSDWYFYSEEEMQELNNYTAEVAGEKYEEAIQNTDLIYDMYAINDNQLDNININLEKMSNAELSSVDFEAAYEATIPAIEETYSNMGYGDLKIEVDTLNLADKEFTCLKSSGDINGLKMYQKIFPIKCNGYLASITVTTYEEDTTDELLSKFYFIEN